jgi:error-prone DNA polymerase
MLAQLERDRWQGRHTGQLGLLTTPAATSMPEPTLHERAVWESEVLGQFVSIHPLQLVVKELSGYNLIGSDELSQHIGQEVTLAGIRLATHRFAARQESMWLVDMEDEHGMYQVLWSSAVLNKYRPVLSQRDPVVIRGRVRTDRQGQVILTGQEIKRLRQA